MSLDLGGGDFVILHKNDSIKHKTNENVSFESNLEQLRNEMSFEEDRLRLLHDRFLVLEDSMNALKEKMKNERYLHRKLIDEMIQAGAEPCDCTILPEKPPTDFMDIDHDSIKAKIRACIPMVDPNEKKDEVVDLDQIKSNLEMYRHEISEVKMKEILNKKRNATVKMLKDHLLFIEKKCEHEMVKLENIQQDLKQLELSDDMDSHLETIFRTDSCNFQTISETPSNSNSYSDSNEHEYLPKTI